MVVTPCGLWRSSDQTEGFVWLNLKHVFYIQDTATEAKKNMFGIEVNWCALDLNANISSGSVDKQRIG